MDQTGFTEVELSGTIPKRWAEGEGEKGAIEELRRRGRKVGEVLAGNRMVQRKMAAMLGGSGYATPEEKDEMEPDVMSVQTEARVAVAGRKSGHFEGHQNNNKGAYAALHESEEIRPLGHRDRVKAGRYDGRTSWEAYRAKFQMVAQANGWNQAEKAVQLAAALEGEALRALSDLSDEELAYYRDVVTALSPLWGHQASYEPTPAPGL
ncbi:UNVERIFIED_CONTAM: hypothetical protein FKN15_016827 [Acipenser sinensis]